MMSAEMVPGLPALTLQLLGSPEVRRGGEPPFRPRGNKVWGLLCYLALTPAAPPRQRLASLLFPEAEDPLAALRWNISELRRLLGEEATVGGDPATLRLRPGTVVDAHVLLQGTWVEAVRLPGLGRDLLEGLDVGSAAGFELWLTNERTRLRAAAEARLREATLASMARGEKAEATDYASRLATLNPYDENAHVLVARSLVDAGDLAGAERHVDWATRLFQEELGIPPSPSFRLAALSHRAAPIPSPSRAAVIAQMEGGEAAIGAGAWLVGLEALRGATVSAGSVGDEHLAARAHLTLGSALVHAARGFDEEGAMSLHAAGELAARTGDRTMAARARRELAYVELLRGRYERAFAWLDEAILLVDNQGAESAWIAAVRGACESDIAHYDAALRSLEDAVARASSAGDSAAGAFSHNFLGRLHLLRSDLDLAADHLDRSMGLARSAAWTAFIPFPMSLRAEVTLLSGDTHDAQETFDHAFALSCQLGDPCWESIGARGLGLVAMARDDVGSALARLDEAPRLCRRFPDSYLWVEAYALEALCGVAVSTGAPAAPSMIAELESMAARTGMRELLARAMLHRVALGEPEALDVARSLVAAIDNPALDALLAAGSA